MDQEIGTFNLGREYYDIDQDLTKTLAHFESVSIYGIRFFINDSIKPMCDNDKLRIMSYNVRYFTSASNEPHIKSIVDIILRYHPHILCLQEIALGNIEYYSTSDLKILFANEFDRLLHYYQVLSVCSSPPGFYMTIYGNMILIKKDFMTNIRDIKNPTYHTMVSQYLCSHFLPLNRPCFMNQQVFTYHNVPPKMMDEHYHIRYQEQRNENKCFIKIVLPFFDLINVHLDAYYQQNRIEQLNQINAQITRPTIIIGDFNFFNVDDFLFWRNLMINSLFIRLAVDVDLPAQVPAKYHGLVQELKERLTKEILTNEKLQMVIYNAIPKKYELRQIFKNEPITEIFKILVEWLQYTDYGLIASFIALDLATINYKDLATLQGDKYKTFYDQISSISQKLDSLEQYFVNKSGSILANTEYKHCMGLGWVTSDASQSINISQWSGTRVDMAWFARFTTVNYTHHLLMTQIDYGSDHFPLIIDILITEPTLRETLKITRIDSTYTEWAIQCNSSELSRPTPHSKTNPCAGKKQMVFLKDIKTFTKTEPLYNAQPISDKSFDWFINDRFTTTSDPYVTAGNDSLRFGRLGIYLTTSRNYLANIGPTLVQLHFKNLKNDPAGLYYAYFVYIFSYQGPDFSEIKIGTGVSQDDMAFKKCYDHEADIITGQMTNRFIYKIPERNANRYLKISGLQIATQLMTVSAESLQKYHFENRSGIIINERTVNELVQKAHDFAEKYRQDDPTSFKSHDFTLDVLKKKIEASYCIILNAIKKINEYSETKYANKFIPQFDTDRLKFEADEYHYFTLCYDIDLNQYKPTLVGGYPVNSFEHKYLKYKYKYLIAKNRKRQ